MATHSSSSDTSGLSLAVDIVRATGCPQEQGLRIANRLLSLRASGADADAAACTLQRELHVTLADARAIAAHAYPGRAAPATAPDNLPTLSARAVTRILIRRGMPDDAAMLAADRIVKRWTEARNAPAPEGENLPTFGSSTAVKILRDQGVPVDQAIRAVADMEANVNRRRGTR
jgi:hypothetical protein